MTRTHLLLNLGALIATLLIPAPTMAAEIDRAEAAALLEQCQAEREAGIAPLREQAIETCVSSEGRSREYCERYNRTFGERTAGGTQRGLFWELPVCEEALDAERYFRMNPGRATYSPPG